LTIRVAIDGIGGYGRHFFLAAEESGFSDLFEVVLINDPAGPESIFRRLNLDSQYGRSRIPIVLDGENIVCRDRRVDLMSGDDPAKIDWSKQEIDVVITAADPGFQTGRNASHLKSGARKVLSIGDSDGADAIIVPGVNDQSYAPDDHQIVSTGTSGTLRAATMISVLTALSAPRNVTISICHSPLATSRVADTTAENDAMSRSVIGNIVRTPLEEIDSVSRKTLFPVPALIQNVVVPSNGVGWITSSCQLDSRESADELLQKLPGLAVSPEFEGLVRFEPANLTARDVLGGAASLVFDNGSICHAEAGLSGFSAWFDADWSMACRGVDLLALMCESGIPGTA
jgi:glyceraldehyde 3-phosphate dehydrogenase (phosphorylating)